MAAFNFPNVIDAMDVRRGPKGLTEGSIASYFVDLAGAARTLQSLNIDEINSIGGTLSDAQKLSLAEYINDTYGLDGEGISLSEAKGMVATLFNADGFKGLPLNQFCSYAHQRIAQNVEVLAPKLTELDTPDLCSRLIEHGVDDADMPLRLIEEFGGEVPTELADHWRRSHARAIETLERVKANYPKRRSRNQEDATAGWARDWFVVTSEHGGFDFFCTINDPRKQRTILIGLEEQVRSEFYENVTTTDVEFNDTNRRLEFHVDTGGDKRAERLLTGLAIESERVLEAHKQQAM